MKKKMKEMSKHEIEFHYDSLHGITKKQIRKIQSHRDIVFQFSYGGFSQVSLK